MEAPAQSELADLICALSQEFNNHRHELKISFEPCNFGPKHKKVGLTSIINLFSARVFLSSKSVFKVFNLLPQ